MWQCEFCKKQIKEGEDIVICHNCEDDYCVECGDKYVNVIEFGQCIKTQICDYCFLQLHEEIEELYEDIIEKDVATSNDTYSLHKDYQEPERMYIWGEMCNGKNYQGQGNYQPHQKG